jgi:DNA-binding MarR family transcriptional regulator
MNYSFFNHSDDLDKFINDAYIAMHYLHRQLIYVPGNKMVHHQLAILTLLSQEGSLYSSEIARRLSLSKPQMTMFIDGLVSTKAVERKADATDRRKTILNITETGNVLLSDYYALVRKNVTEKLAKLDHEQLNTLTSAISQLASLSQINT